MSTAIDISQHSSDISIAQFLEAKKAGCARVIVALNNLPMAMRQISNANAAGLEVEAYVYYYFGQNVGERTRSCLAAVQNLSVSRIWIDCEDEKHDLAGKYLASRIRVARDTITAAGYDTGIYTAAWWWNKHMDGSDEFSDLPLWDATWDKNPDIDKVSYGGWTTPGISQHTNDTTFAGIWCDINSFAGPTPLPVPPQPPQTSSVAQRAIEDIKRATAVLEAALKEKVG